MRPLRLEIAGFSAFRDPIEVDFSDCDYFAFVGPTGAGKSSLIDALTFALYGSIPRLAKGAVLPIISQGKAEMRVRFDFAVGDREYTAVRVVRKLAEDRATTKEARLEHGDTVLAGDADGVTAEVERLLGLGFDEFTRCVVLPQGDFARFMHGAEQAKSAECAAGLLEKIETPREVAGVAAGVAEAVGSAERADAVVARAGDLLKERDAALSSLPVSAPLETALAAHRERAK